MNTDPDIGQGGSEDEDLDDDQGVDAGSAEVEGPGTE